MSESSRRCRLRCGPYLVEISALCFLHLPPHLFHIPFLLAGTSSQLLLYDLKKGRMVKSFHVFEGIRVHGITCSSINGKDRLLSSPLEFRIAVFGERRVKLFKLCIDPKFGFEDHPKESIHLFLFQLLPKFSHWILDVSFLKDYAVLFRKGAIVLPLVVVTTLSVSGIFCNPL